MIKIREGVNLRPYNTFALNVKCAFFCEINSEKDFLDLLSTGVYRTSKRLVLGGGSNVLFMNDFNGLIIKNNLRSINIIYEDRKEALVKAAAGEVWHELVMFTLEKELGGLENLSLIPGCVGASPMQNIGAYGVEIKDVFEELEALSMENGEKRIFTKSECRFGYRESVFKKELKDRYFISSVTFRLQKRPVLHTSYGAINTELVAMGAKDPGIKDISAAVINIRKSKLPDPEKIGNAGSFFKNPEVSEEKYKSLIAAFPLLVAYKLENNNYKLAAGWLIEQCGLKGYEYNGAAVHDRQALVLVNKKGCKGSDVYALSEYVMEQVQNKFGVSLEREVNVIK